MWQMQPGHPERLDPNHVYGTLGSDFDINQPMQPWAGEANWMQMGTGWPVRPWYAPDDEQVAKTSKHPSVVEPPRYDTLPLPPRRWRVSWGGTSKWRGINTQFSTFDVGLGELGFGDFNGTGRTDVFRAAGGVWLVSYGGTGRFMEINQSSVGLDNLAFGDFDGDGMTDVFRAAGGVWRVSWGGTSRWEEINQSSVGLDNLAFGDFTVTA